MGKFVINKTKTGYTFHLRAGNGETIATSEVYTSLKSCKAGIASVMKNAPIANLENQTADGCEVMKHPKFEVYESKNGESRFRLKAKNGEIIASSEGYATLKSCLNGVESVRRNAPDAEIAEPEE